MCPARLDDADGLTPFKEENAAGREQAPRRAGSDYAAHATQKIQVPRDKRRIFIPFADIRSVDRSRVLGFPAVRLETETRRWEFVVLRRAALLRGLRSCWQGREISF